jgi:hypothetical protein
VLADSGCVPEPCLRLADRVFRLINGRLDELSIDSDMPLKIMPDTKSRLPGEHEQQPVAGEPAKAFTKAQTQKKAREDAASDLIRKTGDLSLYGLFIILLHFPI